MVESRKPVGSAGNRARVDNYEEFIERLDAASAKLTVRRDRLDTTLEILTVLFRQNNSGLQLWEDRLIRFDALLADSAKVPDREAALVELHEIALKMEPLFRNRTQRIEERLTVVRARRDEINKSLAGLEKSRMKLTSSRMLAQERENLSRAVGELVGTPDTAAVVNPDPGLRTDLQDARHAIILAEALLEAKRDR
jgi:prefoldin subunit 5